MPRILVLILSLLVPSFAMADFELGKEAYRRGQFEEAARLFQDAAEKRDPRSMYSLGLLYHQGLGVLQDDAVAIVLWEQAAAMGFVHASVELATMYETGRGVGRDLRRAHMWYNLAAARGSRFSVVERDRVAALLTVQELDQARQMARAWLAAHPANNVEPQTLTKE